MAIDFQHAQQKAPSMIGGAFCYAAAPIGLAAGKTRKEHQL
ncbi:hypothetical protein [Rhizobium leguminosarum]|nr:hypothetical protein [Rhizobium leguminosarum]